MIIYTGFIYIWYDTKAKLFYLGGHYGRMDDGYICSSKTMLNAYRKRPHTFKRKILEFTFGDTKDLRAQEQKWLNMIKPSEVLITENVQNNTHRYYNVKLHAAGGNGIGTNKGKSHIPWNKGMTKEEMQSYVKPIKEKTHKTKKLKTPKLQKQDKPPKIYNVFFISCETCSNLFTARKENRRFCSTSCKCSYAAKCVKLNGMKTENGRNNFKEAIRGRKRKYLEDGTWIWSKEKVSPLFDRVELIPQTLSS